MVVILCGGFGLRIRGQFEDVPKPLIPIHGKELLLHIIHRFSEQGFSDFLLLVGNNEDQFVDFAQRNSNEAISISVLQTGSETPTGGRLKKAEHLLENLSSFILTYGDGLANIDFDKLLSFHQNHSRIATLTAVKPTLQYGVLSMDEDGLVNSFIEKPILETYINGGFFVLNNAVFSYLHENSDFETEVLVELSKSKELVAYKYHGFWKSMDTYKDYLSLNELIENR